jgi:CubicO group peptidase (beta-lactamase class C family)
MKRTQANDYETLVMNRAQGYIYRDGAFHNKDFYDTSNTFSAGILISTVQDLLTWSESVFDDRILNADYRRLWWTPHPSQAGNERDNHFILGLGWFRVDDQGVQLWGHNGGILGFASAFMYLPARDITAVMLCNAGNIPNPHHIALNWIAEFMPS